MSYPIHLCLSGFVGRIFMCLNIYTGLSSKGLVVYTLVFNLKLLCFCECIEVGFFVVLTVFASAFHISIYDQNCCYLCCR